MENYKTYNSEKPKNIAYLIYNDHDNDLINHYDAIRLSYNNNINNSIYTIINNKPT